MEAHFLCLQQPGEPRKQHRLKSETQLVLELLQSGGGTGTKHPSCLRNVQQLVGAEQGSPASLLPHYPAPLDSLQVFISNCSVGMCRRSGAAGGDGLLPKQYKGGLISKMFISADRMAIG